MKLKIQENYNDTVYIDIVPYIDTIHTITEDKIDPEDTISVGDMYKSQLDTRWHILLDYIVPISKSIGSLKYIESAEPRASSPNNERGLSNYIDVVFNHPENISDEDIEKFYTYTIRFSDHENNHIENGEVEEVKIVGMKAKNLHKAAMKVFKNKLFDIERDIEKFEKRESSERKSQNFNRM